VWRKLQQLGAISLQDAIWVLPKSTRNQEQFEWLASEIHEFQGQATLWEAKALSAGDEAGLRRQFVDAAETIYHEIIESLKSTERDPSSLSRRFQEAQSKDFFASQLSNRVREKLLAEGKE
jgi:hypothetical protein